MHNSLKFWINSLYYLVCGAGKGLLILRIENIIDINAIFKMHGVGGEDGPSFETWGMVISSFGKLTSSEFTSPPFLSIEF